MTTFKRPVAGRTKGNGMGGHKRPHGMRKFKPGKNRGGGR